MHPDTPPPLPVDPAARPTLGRVQMSLCAVVGLLMIAPMFFVLRNSTHDIFYKIGMAGAQGCIWFLMTAGLLWAFGKIIRHCFSLKASRIVTTVLAAGLIGVLLMSSAGLALMMITENRRKGTEAYRAAEAAVPRLLSSEESPEKNREAIARWRETAAREEVGSRDARAWRGLVLRFDTMEKHLAATATYSRTQDELDRLNGEGPALFRKTGGIEKYSETLKARGEAVREMSASAMSYAGRLKDAYLAGGMTASRADRLIETEFPDWDMRLKRLERAYLAVGMILECDRKIAGTLSSDTTVWTLDDKGRIDTEDDQLLSVLVPLYKERDELQRHLTEAQNDIRRHAGLDENGKPLAKKPAGSGPAKSSAR